MSNAINNLEETLENYGVDPLKVSEKKLGEKPLPIIYRPEIDVLSLLKDELYSQYLQPIGILIWSIELEPVYMFN